MTSERKRELEVNLAKLIDQQRLLLTADGVLSYIAEHLQIYLGRWLPLPQYDAPMTVSLDHVLFGCLEVGVDAMNKELATRSLPEGVAAAWSRFLSAFDALKRHQEKSLVSDVELTLNMFVALVIKKEG